METRLQRQVTQAVYAGAELDQIEAVVIDPAPIDEEEKAALWLYAEALVERRAESMLVPEQVALIGT